VPIVKWKFSDSDGWTWAERLGAGGDGGHGARAGRRRRRRRLHVPREKLRRHDRALNMEHTPAPAAARIEAAGGWVRTEAELCLAKLKSMEAHAAHPFVAKRLAADGASLMRGNAVSHPPWRAGRVARAGRRGLQEAEPLYREALAGRRRTLGGEHPDTQGSINNLAVSAVDEQGKLGDAEPLYREALAGQRRTLGDEHPSTLTSINNLGAPAVRPGQAG
jgi:hypothetical protein